MRLALNSELWNRLYYNLREEFYRQNVGGDIGRDQIREFLAEYGVKIKADPNWGNWEEVEIVLSDEELTLFLLRWL
jgi:hypothetical protein